MITKQCISLTRLLKQNLPPHQHTVFSPICNISHIVSSLLHCGLQRNDQCRTHSQHLVPHLLPSNRQPQEYLGQCQNLMESQTELHPGKPFSSVFLKDQEEHSTQADWFWTQWPVLSSFSELPQQIFCQVNRYFLCCCTARIWLQVQAWHRTDIR